MNARDGGPNVARVYGVHVETAGAGSPLVLIHGFAMHGGVFAPLVPALARGHRVHVVDLPGHGASAPVAPYDLATLASALDQATASEEAPLALLGWSLGGMVALEFARARPERVRRLVLVATTPSFVARADWPHAMAATTLARFGDELRVAYRATLLRFLTLQVQGSDEGRRTLASLRERLFARGDPDPTQLDAALALLRDADLRPALSGVRAPALVIGGARDALVPLAATYNPVQDADWFYPTPKAIAARFPSINRSRSSADRASPQSRRCRPSTQRSPVLLTTFWASKLGSTSSAGSDETAS